MSWLSTLQAEPWYQTISADFATNAPDVPFEVWAGELLSEDSSLNPSQEDYKNSGHWGLFQENSAFPMTVGLPAASTQQLQDPTFNAHVAALAMENAIKSSNSNTLQSDVEALERAGWPGAVSSEETQSRLGAIDSIYRQEEQTAPDPNAPLSSSSNSGGGALGALLGPDAMSKLQSLATDIFVGGVIIAIITGGFVLLGQSIGVKGPDVVV